MTASNLTSQLLELSKAPPTDLSEDERKAVLAACDSVRVALENPLEAMLRHMLGALNGVALRIAVDMGLVDIITQSKGPVSAEELASKSNSDVVLVVRIMRMMVGLDLFKEVGHHLYAATPLVGAFVTGSPLKDAVIHLGAQLACITALPEFFEVKGYKNPEDGYDGPFQLLHPNANGQHYFEWLPSQPRLQDAFNTTMSVSRMQRGQDWFEFYPVTEKLQVNDPSDIVLLDIGGNVGHDLINFNKKFPDIAGKLVLEDLPQVIDAAKGLPEAITTVSHDFFKPQPTELQGAKAIYMRTVLHDWPDKQAKLILENIRKIMSKDSVLLINENVLPEDNVALYQAQIDFMMLGSLAALDRTEKQFEELLDSVGFKLIGTWKPKDFVPGSGTLFEAVLKE